MVDDVKDITEKAESKEALDRARLLRERREAEQRRRLDDLRAHAAAAQAQREKREGERRKRQAEQRARDDDRRQQVEERKRAIWEASISRREALLQRERDRGERMERARAARSAPRPAFAFGSSTPRLLEPVDSAGFFWAARSTNPVDQMNFFDSLAASTTNVMYASAPLTRRASALQLDSSDTDNKDEADRSPQAVMWSSVARRRTDLVPTVPAPRAPGRAYSMTRLDKLPSNRPLHSASPSMHHLNRNQTRSGETTPGSRPGSAMSNATGVVRRANSAPRKPRPASIAGTGCNTPRGETGGLSATSTPAVSRDGSTIARPSTTPRKPRPLSLHVSPKPTTPLGPGEGKPPMHRKPKPAKDQDKGRRKSLSASPGRALSPSPAHTKETSVDKEMSKSMTSERQVDPQQVTQKLEALQVQDTPIHTIENKENIEANIETNIEDNVEVNRSEVKIEVQKPEETQEVQKVEPKKEASVEKTEDNEMTASMISRRITTEEEAKAALAERRRRAREELERQAELDRLRLQREAEEEAERQRQEEERQRREEEEARELAALQRKMEEEKLKKAIEAQQQLEREEAERKVREELDKQARIKEEEEKRRAAEEAEKIRKEELEREEKERLARKQRVEAIMARTRLKKQAEEEKKKEQEKAVLNQNAEIQNPVSAQQENKMEVSQDNSSKTVEGATPTVTESTVTQIVESVNVTPNVTESLNVTSNATESVNVTSNVTESSNVTDSKVMTGKESGDVAETIKVGIPNVSELVKIAEPKISELVNVSESECLIELTKDSVNEVTDNGNVQTADLLSLATSQPAGKSLESWQPHVNNGNVEPLAANARTDNKLSQESGEQSSMKIDNANVETNNGNVSNVGHISANFLHSERMSEHNQKEMDEFTTHNGHGITHPLTLQNAI